MILYPNDFYHLIIKNQQPFQMYYYQYPQKNSLQNRVKELQQDKRQLSSAIDELNSCYQDKISLLEKTIAEQQQKNQELLMWKENHVDKSMFDIERYELQIKKMIQILDTAHKNFQTEKENLLTEISQQQQVIKELREQNEALNHFNSQNQTKIQFMVKTYTEEIEKLKQELKDLREQSMISEQSSIVALRDITSSQSTENIEPNSKISLTDQIKDTAFSKLSLTTMME